MRKSHRTTLCPFAIAILFGAVPAWAEEAVTLSTVTVTAASDEVAERRDAVNQKTVVGRKEIEAMGGLTVGETLAKLPGVEVGSGGAPHARGMPRDSVQILVDGERLSANSRQAMTMISRLPASDLERVEIVRGTSAEFGAVPVTVNLVMRKAIPKDTRTYKVTVGVRDGEPNANINLVRGGGDKGFSWLLPLTLLHHGSVSDKTSTRQAFSSGVRTLLQVDREHAEAPMPGVSFAPRFTWRDGADSFTLSPNLVYMNGDRTTTMSRTTDGLPDGGRVDREEGDSRQLRLRAEGEKQIQAGKLSGRLAIARNGRDTVTEHDSYDAGGIHTVSRESLNRREDEANGAVRLDHAEGEHLLAGSLEWQMHRRRDEHSETTRTVYRAEERQWTAWLQDEWSPAANLAFTGGLRGEAVTLGVDGSTRDYRQLSPSVAVRWEASEGWVLRSSLGAGLKPPRLDELTGAPVTSLSANTPLEPDRRGNPDLKPERSLNFEAVLERYLPGKVGVLAANLYWRATRDFVEHRVAQEGVRWVDRPYNEGDARHWGLELDAKLKTDAWGPKGGNLRAHLVLPRGEVDDVRLGLTRPARETPTYQLTLGYDQNLPAWRASAGFQVQHYGRTKTDMPGEEWAEAGPRSLLDIYLQRRLGRDLSLRLNVQNIFQGDSDRSAWAWSGADAWSLGTADYGKRRIMLTLEGSW